MATAPAADLVRARTELGLGVLRSCLEDQPHANAFISPHSIAGALAVLLAGSRGAMRDALAGALGSADPAEHAALNAALREPIEGVDLRMATAVFSHSGHPVRAEFAERVTEELAVELRSRDFSDPATVAEINEWASANTDGMVPQIIGELRSEEIVAVLDAILFIGTWTVPFERADTAPATFHRADGGTIELPLMQRHDRHMPYFEDDRCQAIRLSYGEGGRVSFVAVLPRENVSVTELVAGLDASGWADLTARLQARNGRVRLPRFKVDRMTPLIDPLKAVGLAPLFHESPDWDPMIAYPPPCRVGRALQRAVLEVFEEGTRAAAVTLITVEPTSVPPPPFDFTADRPFLCGIEDGATGTLLFVGAINAPEVLEQA